MGAKRLTSQKTFNYWLKTRTTKSPTFYALAFVAIFFLICADNIFSDSSSQSIDFASYEKVGEFDIPQTEKLTELLTTTTNTSGIYQLSLQENVEESDTENHDPLIPPENISREERIAWFRRQLPELEILQSSSLSQQFHSRILNFLNLGCSVLFHIIWMSPAKSFGRREFLTMDTLFKAHPEGCLLVISRSMDSRRGYRILKPLLDRGMKVFAITPDLPFLVKDTPLEVWLAGMNSGTQDPGHIPLSQNLSNLIRLAMLYKYGGVYMDTDLIILKDFRELRNTIGAQSIDSVTRKWTRLNNAIMIFDINHPILLDFMQEFASRFDGNRWGYNGPYLVSRVIEKLGSTPGYNLTIMPPKAFYPVDWHRIGKLYKKPENEIQSTWVESRLNELNEEETYAVHLWNKVTRDLIIEGGSVMARLISDHCVVCSDITKV